MCIGAVIDDLRQKLVERGLDTAIFEDVLEDYGHMLFELQNVREMAKQIQDDPRKGSLYIRCLGRISQIEKDKRATLNYLGIDPKQESVKKESYEL